MKRRTSQPASCSALVWRGRPGRRPGSRAPARSRSRRRPCAAATRSRSAWRRCDAACPGRGSRWRVQIVRKRSSIIDCVTDASREQVAQRLRRPAGQRVLDRHRVVEAAEHRLPERARQLVVVQDVRQVGQRAGGAGDRDAAVRGAVRRRQPGPVRRDAGVAPVVLGRDLRPEQLTEADAPEGRRAAVTQHRPVATRQHRRQPSRLLPEAEMPDGVHASVDPEQPPRGGSRRDRVGAQIQLPAGDHPVLAGRQRRQFRVPC